MAILVRVAAAAAAAEWGCRGCRGCRRRACLARQVGRVVVVVGAMEGGGDGGEGGFGVLGGRLGWDGDGECMCMIMGFLDAYTVCLRIRIALLLSTSVELKTLHFCRDKEYSTQNCVYPTLHCAHGY